MKKVLFIWDVPEDLRHYFEENVDIGQLELQFVPKDQYHLHVRNVSAILGGNPPMRCSLKRVS